MALVVPNVSEPVLLQMILGASAGGKVRLYQSTTPPSATSVFADFVQATFAGYSEKVLSGGAVTSGGSPSFATITWASVDFVAAAGVTPQTVYGYYVVSSTGSVLWWAEAFVDTGGTPTPVVIDTPGQILRLTPRLDLRSQFLD